MIRPHPISKLCQTLYENLGAGIELGFLRQNPNMPNMQVYVLGSDNRR